MCSKDKEVAANYIKVISGGMTGGSLLSIEIL
jgi:hypothetical protein